MRLKDKRFTYSTELTLKSPKQLTAKERRNVQRWIEKSLSGTILYVQVDEVSDLQKEGDHDD